MSTSRHADCRKNIYIATSCSPEPVRARKDKRGVDLVSDSLPFGRLWYNPRLARNRAREVLQPLA
jgi:hypothetical protein